MFKVMLFREPVASVLADLVDFRVPVRKLRIEDALLRMLVRFYIGFRYHELQGLLVDWIVQINHFLD